MLNQLPRPSHHIQHPPTKHTQHHQSIIQLQLLKLWPIQHQLFNTQLQLPKLSQHIQHPPTKHTQHHQSTTPHLLPITLQLTTNTKHPLMDTHKNPQSVPMKEQSHTTQKPLPPHTLMPANHSLKLAMMDTKLPQLDMLPQSIPTQLPQFTLMPLPQSINHTLLPQLYTQCTPFIQLQSWLPNPSTTLLNLSTVGKYFLMQKR
jgi:hypothetical protein